MCVPRVGSSTTLLVKLRSRMKPMTTGQRMFSTMRCGPKTAEVKTYNNSMSSCPAVTYISILTIFTAMVVINNSHGSQAPHKMIK